MNDPAMNILVNVALVECFPRESGITGSRVHFYEVFHCTENILGQIRQKKKKSVCVYHFI